MGQIRKGLICQSLPLLRLWPTRTQWPGRRRSSHEFTHARSRHSLSDLEISPLQAGMERLGWGHSQAHKSRFQMKEVWVCWENPRELSNYEPVGSLCLYVSGVGDTRGWRAGGVGTGVRPRFLQVSLTHTFQWAAGCAAPPPSRGCQLSSSLWKPRRWPCRQPASSGALLASGGRGANSTSGVAPTGVGKEAGQWAA